ncbi:unnamed protein product, partial [Pylaiella littoralis]
QPDSSFGYGLNYNPMDPYNMYPHHETGEKVYGPPPMFGYNKHDPFNMKPFNPNVFGSLFGTPAAQPPVPAAMNTLGPNPFTPLLQPATHRFPPAPLHIPPPNPLLLASAMSDVADSSFNLPSYNYNYNYDPFMNHWGTPQHIHPTDPNNQYPNPLSGSMTEPGPALAGGYNIYDPHNVIGAPAASSDRERALEHNRAAMQAQSPYAPYRMHVVPVPPS